MRAKEWTKNTARDFALPYAGIIQVRFKGFISPEDCIFRTPSVAAYYHEKTAQKNAIGELTLCRHTRTAIREQACAIEHCTRFMEKTTRGRETERSCKTFLPASSVQHYFSSGGLF